MDTLPPTIHKAVDILEHLFPYFAGLIAALGTGLGFWIKKHKERGRRIENVEIIAVRVDEKLSSIDKALTLNNDQHEDISARIDGLYETIIDLHKE